MVSQGYISCPGMVLEALCLSGYMGKIRGELIPQRLCLPPARFLCRLGRVLGTDLCPKVKVRKYRSGPREGGDGGGTEWRVGGWEGGGG